MRRLLLKLDGPLFFLMMILFILGLIMIFSASTIESFMRYGTSPYYFFIKQGIFLVAGFIAFLIIIRIPLKIYHDYIWYAVYAVVFMLFFLLAYGQAINDAYSWIRIGNLFSIQPSEFAKTIMILLMASFYHKNINRLDNYVIALTPPAIGLIMVAMTMFQPDLGTALVLALIVFNLFMVAPVAKTIKKDIIKIIIGGILVAIMVMIMSGRTILTSIHLERLNFLVPCSRFETTGYHVCNGYIAINNGGLFGVGLGNSTQKYSYLPEAHTDFIFAIVLEELGLLISLSIICAFAVILWRIVKISRRSNNLMQSMIAYGVFLYILLHLVINLSGLLGLMPLTGIPLPFFSYGGSYLLNLFIALALVQRIHIENYNPNKIK
ncbi:MAG: FtsW/RodA/SpoVE family cell cycle protein [Bacilli bacterium]|jgi:cell division protein FtsW